MNRKALILASAGVLSLGLVAATNAGVSSQGIARAENHSHGEASLTEIGFDWRDPTKDGYKPYWRCATCCSSNPASSRFKYEDKATAVTADSLKLTALTAASAPTEDNSIKNVSIPSGANIDQSNACYVTVDSKTAAYFSRSRALDSNGYAAEQFNNNPSSFGFTYSGTDAVTSITFSYRYKSWNYNLSKGSLSDYVSCEFAYTKDSAVTTSNYSLDNKIFNDDIWHTVTITAKEVGVDSFASLTNFSFKFADLRGYFMISGLSYSTSAESKDDLEYISSKNADNVAFGSVDFSDVKSYMTSCHFGESGAFSDSSCEASITASNLFDTSGKTVYVKVPLGFETLTESGRQSQENAMVRLKMDVELNSDLVAGASVSAKLVGYKSGSWFVNNMSGDFLTGKNLTADSSNTISGTSDTAIKNSGIYALVTLDFSGCDEYALKHVSKAFAIKTSLTPYTSKITDFTGSYKSIVPTYYIRGDHSSCSWNENKEIFLMVPDVDWNSDTVQVWTYKVTGGFTRLKVFDSSQENGWRTCNQLDSDTGNKDSDGNASLNSTGKYIVRCKASQNGFWANTVS